MYILSTKHLTFNLRSIDKEDIYISTCVSMANIQSYCGQAQVHSDLCHMYTESLMLTLWLYV